MPNRMSKADIRRFINNGELKKAAAVFRRYDLSLDKQDVLGSLMARKASEEAIFEGFRYTLELMMGEKDYAHRMDAFKALEESSIGLADKALADALWNTSEQLGLSSMEIAIGLRTHFEMLV